MKNISDCFKGPRLSKLADSGAICLVPIVSVLEAPKHSRVKLEKASPLEHNVLFSNVF